MCHQCWSQLLVVCHCVLLPLMCPTPQVCCYNGTTPTTNGTLRNGLIPIASAEMCFYCFDVLYSHLHNMETPSTPDFTNEPLWVWSLGFGGACRETVCQPYNMGPLLVQIISEVTLMINSLLLMSKFCW